MATRRVVLVGWGLILGGLLSAPHAAGDGLTWVPAPNLPNIKTDLGIVADAQGKISVVGGSQGGYRDFTYNTVDVFDEATQTWGVGPVLNVERHGLRCVKDSLGRIWAVGGTNEASGGVPFDTVERYDPADAGRGWVTQSGRLNVARSHMGIAIDSQDRIYVFGGYNANAADSLNGNLRSAEMYDPAADEWTLVPSTMQDYRASPGYAMDASGRIYAIGGQNTVDLRTVERFDPVAGTWESVASLPDACGAALAAFYLCGDIWAVGGWANGMTNACRIYDPDTNTWRDGPPMYEALVAAGAAMGPSGAVYLVGGERSAGVASDHVAMLCDGAAPSPIPEPAFLGVIGMVAAMGTVWRRWRQACGGMPAKT